MSFEDLPADWATRPLTDLDIADVLDLFVTEQARARGALYLLLCDNADRLLAPLAIDEIDALIPVRRRVDMLTTMLSAAPTDLDGSVMVAIARPGGPAVTADDRVWARAVATAAEGRWRLLGIRLVTPRGIGPLVMPASAA